MLAKLTAHGTLIKQIQVKHVTTSRGQTVDFKNTSYYEDNARQFSSLWSAEK